MSLSIQPRARAIFIWVALIPVSLACLTYWTRIQFKQTVARVSHTEQVLGAIDDIVDTITSAETGQRGFLLRPRQWLRWKFAYRECERVISRPAGRVGFPQTT